MKQKMTLVEALKQVEESASSIFSKEDVLNILKSISSKELNIYEINEALDTIIDGIEFVDYLDNNNSEFYLEGNKVFIQHIELNTTNLSDMIIESLNNEIEMLSLTQANVKENGTNNVEINIEKKGCGEDCLCKKKKKKEKR